jgi:hypothetical protein
MVHRGKGSVKCVEIPGFLLKGRAIFQDNQDMSYAMRRLLNQLPISLGMRSDRRLRTTTRKHAQFASFLETEGFLVHNVDHYERSLRRRRALKWLLVWATAFGVAWIALESARALTLF